MVKKSIAVVVSITIITLSPGIDFYRAFAASEQTEVSASPIPQISLVADILGSAIATDLSLHMGQGIRSIPDIDRSLTSHKNALDPTILALWNQLRPLLPNDTPLNHLPLRYNLRDSNRAQFAIGSDKVHHEMIFEATKEALNELHLAENTGQISETTLKALAERIWEKLPIESVGNIDQLSPESLQISPARLKILSSAAHNAPLLKPAQTEKAKSQSAVEQLSMIMHHTGNSDTPVAEIRNLPIPHRSRSIAFTADSRKLKIALVDGTISIWNFDEQTELLHPKSLDPKEDAFTISADGHTYATAAEDTIKLWNAESGNKISEFKITFTGIHSLAFSPDRHTLAVAADGKGADGMLSLWNMDTGKETLPIISGRLYGGSSPSAVVFSPQGDILATGNPDGDIGIWDVRTGKEILLLDGYRKSSANTASELALNNRPMTLISTDGKLRRWDATTGKEVRISNARRGPIGAVAFSPNGRMIAAAHMDGIIALWDITTGKEILSFYGPNGDNWGYFDSIAFSPDNLLLATAGKDKFIRIWDVGALSTTLDSAPEVALKRHRTSLLRIAAKALHIAVSLGWAIGLNIFAYYRHVTAPRRYEFYHKIAVASHHHHAWTFWERFDLGWFNDFLTVPTALAMGYLGHIIYTACANNDATQNATRKEKAVVMAGVVGVAVIFAIFKDFMIKDDNHLDFIDWVMYAASGLITAALGFLLWWPKNNSEPKSFPGQYGSMQDNFGNYDVSREGVIMAAPFILAAIVGTGLHMLSAPIYFSGWLSIPALMAIFSVIVMIPALIVFQKRHNLSYSSYSRRKQENNKP